MYHVSVNPLTPVDSSMENKWTMILLLVFSPDMHSSLVHTYLTRVDTHPLLKPPSCWIQILLNLTPINFHWTIRT
jgi:hypothetical protein